MVDLGLFSQKIEIAPDGESLQVEKNFTRWQKVFCHLQNQGVQEAGKKAQENLTRTRESSGWKGPELLHQVFDLVGLDGDAGH